MARAERYVTCRGGGDGWSKDAHNEEDEEHMGQW